MSARRERLTRERVIGAAVEIVDRDGLDALTMRALGRELGVDPMAVYHHLRGKAAILDGVVEAVLREVPLDASPELGWAERFAALARGYRAALRSHPNALPVVATRPDVTPAALRILDTALAIVLEAGLDPAEALGAVHAASCFILGHALDEAGLGAGEDISVAETAAAQQHLLASGDYPNLAAVALSGAEIRADDTFEMGLAALMSGLLPESRRHGRIGG
jgi:TetR/AcrR family tetracycline transcriptional repressor